MATALAFTPASSLFSPFALVPTIGLRSLLPTTVTGTALPGFVANSTTVQLSRTGQLLSALDMFRATLANLRPGSATSGLGDNFGTDIASLAAEAQNFVDAFNTLQANLTRSPQPLGALFAEPLSAQFSRTLNGLVAAPLGGDDPALTSLAQLGISLQASPTEVGGTLAIDLDTLKSAFASNPAGAFAALDRAVQLFGDAAASLADRASRETVSLAAFAQFGFGQTAPGLLGMFNLLALSSFNLGNATTVTQQMVALNEYMLVSTLLG